VAIIAVVTALLATPGIGRADQGQGGGANHVVLATSTADGSLVSRSGVQVASVGSSTVTSDNIARAGSSDCTGCQAIALAFQAIFITRDASTVIPGNAAVATNANCVGCASFAFAYQYVLSTPGPGYLSEAGRQRVDQIRRQAAQDAASGLPFDQLDADLRELADQFKAVIDQELQRAGLPADGSSDARVNVAPANA
jgi:putative peptide zinc metalloprotease protein